MLEVGMLYCVRIVNNCLALAFICPRALIEVLALAVTPIDMTAVSGTPLAVPDPATVMILQVSLARGKVAKEVYWAEAKRKGERRRSNLWKIIELVKR